MIAALIIAALLAGVLLGAATVSIFAITAWDRGYEAGAEDRGMFHG